MKNFKKIASAIAALSLAACVAVPMSATVFTASAVEITFSNEEGTGHKYQYYQVFKGVATESNMNPTETKVTLTNVTWGDGVNYTQLLAELKADATFGTDTDNIFKDCDSAQKVANALDSVKFNSAEAKRFAELVAKNTTPKAFDGTKNEIKEDGYYVLADAKDSTTDGTKTLYLLGVVDAEAKDAITVNVKAEAPEFTKEIGDINDSTESEITWGASADHDKYNNDEVPFKLKATLPADFAEYEHYQLIFHDDLQANVFTAPTLATDFTVKIKSSTDEDKVTLSSTDGDFTKEDGCKKENGHSTHGELHTQPNRKLFDVMTKGSGDARMQPLYFLITTAGTDTHSICYETHQKAKDILEGRKIDKTFYPVIYGADESEDWTSPEVWKKANPSLGITVGIDKVQAACDSARQNPGEENAFRQLRLNQWVKQSVRWMPMEKWDLCKTDFDETFLEGRVCYGGLDLSSTTDITAFVLVFPPISDDDKYYVLPYFWLPEETLNLRVRRDHVPYDIWNRQGFLLTTEGNVVHYGFIENFIDELGKKFNIREIAFDRWGAVQMSQNLTNLGFTLVQFGQGFRDMSPPTKELMKLVLERNIAHGGHPVLRWNMDNIFIKRDPAGNIKPDKEKSTEKIDGAVALIMALDRAIRCGAETDKSIYDERDLFIL